MKLRNSIFFFVAAWLLACPAVFALTAQEAMAKSKAWFKTSKAWSLDFKLQVIYAESPDIDGRIRFTAEETITGDFARVTITDIVDGEPFGIGVPDEEERKTV